MKIITVLSRSLFALVLISAAHASFADKDKSQKPAATLGGSGKADITCEPMPGEAAGHFVCEDPDSFKRCKTLEGKGKVRLEGAKEDTKVLMCVQGG